MSLSRRILVGLGIGLGVGLWLHSAGGVSHPLYGAVNVVGEMFLRLLRMVIVPLILTSVVHAAAGLEVHHLGRLGLRTLAYYLITTAMAVLLGMALVNGVRPGWGAQLGLTEVPERLLREGPPTLGDLLLHLIPDNPIDALARMDVLQIIVFGLFLGVALGALGERAATSRRWVEELFQATMLIVHWVLQVLPIGVAALLARAVGRAGWEMAAPLGKYMATVIIGLLLHGGVVLPFLLWALGRMSPWLFFRGVNQALLTAFSTSSSSATLPVTLEVVEGNLKVPKHVARFVLPLGATVNMDGTALYEAVAATFIAQAYQVSFTWTQQAMVFLTATLAAIGAAGIPEAGLFTMVMVLRAVGLPTEGIGLILAVDRFLDMCRTTVNVLGDMVGAVIVSRWEKEERESPGGEALPLP